MEADHRAQVEELLAGYRRSREQLGTVHRKLATLRESATSEDGLVTVTVGPQGRVCELVIVDSAYRRLRPHELAATIVALGEKAAAKVSRAAGEVLGPVLPPDTDPAALLAGTADLTEAELEPEPPEPDETFEDLSWMRAGGRKR